MRYLIVLVGMCVLLNHSYGEVHVKSCFKKKSKIAKYKIDVKVNKITKEELLSFLVKSEVKLSGLFHDFAFSFVTADFNEEGNPIIMLGSSPKEAGKNKKTKKEFISELKEIIEDWIQKDKWPSLDPVVTCQIERDLAGDNGA